MAVFQYWYKTHKTCEVNKHYKPKLETCINTAKEDTVKESFRSYRTKEIIANI